MRISARLERSGDDTPACRTRTFQSWLGRALIAVVVVAAVTAAVVALVATWSEVRGELGAADPGWLALASACAVGNVLAAAGTWRAALAALGSPVPVRPAAAIFCIGQLGKYLPGSVWPIVVQAQLTSRRGVPPSHVVLAGALALTEAAVMSLALGLMAVPALIDAADADTADRRMRRRCPAVRRCCSR